MKHVYSLLRSLPLALLVAASLTAHAQAPTGSVGIGTTAPDASAALDIVSSSKGALLPRVPDATAIASPATGLIVFQTGGTAGFYYNAGTPTAPNWQQLATVGAGTGGGDNLGNHTATQNLNLQGNALTGSGNDIGNTVGVGIRTDGGLNLGQNTPGNSVLLGYQAGNVNAGYYNVFSGYQSGFANTYGYRNVFSGYQSGYPNTTGNNNVFSGFRSGYYNTTGSNLTAIGANSGPASNAPALDNATAVGANVGLTASNTVVLGNGANVGIGTSSPSQKLEVAGTVKISGAGNGLAFPDNTVQTTAAVSSTANNGLTKTGTSIGLGGTLTQATTIAQAGNALGITGGNVGIGTSTPAGLFTVEGSVPGTTAALDQQQMSNEVAVGADDHWQSFTAGISGQLTRIDLLLSSAGISNGTPGVLSVYAGEGTGGALLATQAVVYNVVPSGTYQAYSLATPVPVVAGQQYTYRFQTTPGRNIFASESSSSLYAGGVASIAAGTQQANAYDFCFKTYVAAPVGRNVLTALNGGNVGIGTTTPSQALEVAGQVYSNAGGFRFPDNTVQTTAATPAAPTTASNGLTKTGNDIALGGALTQPTTLAAGANPFALTQTGPGLGAIAPDQGTRNSPGTAALNGANYQTVTAGVAGALTQIELSLGACTNNSFTLTVYNGAGTGGTVLYTGTVVCQGSYYGSRAYPVTGVTLAAGQVFTIGVSGSAPNWVYNASDVYAGGQAGFNSTADFLFSTTMQSLTTTLNALTVTGGNVGLGTTTPTQKLDVAGGIRFTGAGNALTFPDGTTQTTAATPAAPTTASNGLTKTTNNIALGGPLTANTDVGLNSKALTFSGAGNVGIGTTAPAASAALDVSSTSQGLLPPRMTQPQRDAIGSPAAGLTIYNTTTNALNVWNGTSWGESLTSATQPVQQYATRTFNYTGGPQTYTVPAGVYSLTVDAYGAQGGSSNDTPPNRGGLGARATATLAVTPGETLTLYVGGVGTTTGAGYNGGGSGIDYGGNRSGGGGGATDVRRGSAALADRLLVAAGGGGGGAGSGGYVADGGMGGATVGGNGRGFYGTPGTGATQTAGGNSGGALGQGGNGINAGGGGGGGYYGGGASTGIAGGGGGSSWATAAGSSGVSLSGGVQTGAGVLYLTAGPVYYAPTLDGTNISGTWSVSGADVYRATGSVGIGTSAPDASAVLDVSSTSKGLLPPRLTQVQRDAIASPATGLTLYNTTTSKLNTWTGTNWDEAVSLTQQTIPQASKTFSTPGQYTYTVPTGVYSLTVDAAGAAGGANVGAFGLGGGNGGRVQATLTVRPGEILTVVVGGAGSPAPVTQSSRTFGGAGYNGGGNGLYDSGNRGGGGGGATDLRRGGTALANRVVVAAGGGGAGYSGNGGDGGGLSGNNGTCTDPRGTAGTGATQSGGGSSGGTLGQGGNAFLFATGGASSSIGGGGGGYYGGGGGGQFGGGGGGSSWVTPTGSSAVTLTSGYQTGNGSLTLSPAPAYAAPVLDGSNFVNVPGDNLGNHTATQNLNLGTNQLVGTTAVNVGTNLNLGTNKLVGNGGSTGLAVSNTGVLTTDGQVNTGGNLNLGTNLLVGNGGTAGLAVSSTGSVGIGTSSPATTLDVRTADATARITVGTAAATGGGIVFGNANHGIQRGFPTLNSNNDVGFYTTAGNLHLSTNGASTGQFVLLNNGNVGLGTDAPILDLEVLGATVGMRNTATWDHFYWTHDGSTAFVRAGGADNGLAFQVGNGASGTFGGQPYTEALRLLPSGNVGVGTAAPGARLHVAGNMKIDGANTLEFGAGVAGKEVNAGKIGYHTFSSDALDIVGAGNAGGGRLIRFYCESGASFSGQVNAPGFYNSSDLRFKQHVRPLTGALASVLGMRGVRYEWNALGVQRGGAAGAGQVGVIAQELEKLYPELVSTDAQGYKSVNYAQLTPVLLEAIKELKLQLDAQTQRAARAEAAQTADHAELQAVKAQATASAEALEARLRRLEAGSGQAQR